MCFSGRDGSIGGTFRLVALLIFAGGVFLNAHSATAQKFDLPDGFVIVNEPVTAEEKDWRPVMTVRPTEGPFSELSAIHLRLATARVENADAWLKRQLTADIGDLKDAGTVFDDPDSPFNDPFFDTLRKALPELFKSLKQISELPLKFCDPARTGYNASGSYREIYCVFNLGPTRQYRMLRLQEIESHWFYTDIRTMNERRLRDLVAIANSFRLDD